MNNVSWTPEEKAAYEKAKEDPESTLESITEAVNKAGGNNRTVKAVTSWGYALLHENDDKTTTPVKTPRPRWKDPQLFALGTHWTDPKVPISKIVSSVNAIGPVRSESAIAQKGVSLYGERVEPVTHVPEPVPVPTDKQKPNYANHVTGSTTSEALQKAKEAEEKLLKESLDAKKKDKMAVEFLKYDKSTEEEVTRLKSMGYEVDIIKSDGKPDEIRFRKPKPIEVPRELIIPRKTVPEKELSAADSSSFATVMNLMQETNQLLAKNNDLLGEILKLDSARTEAAIKYAQGVR